MKKTISLVLAFTMAVLAIGCSNRTEPMVTDVATTTPLSSTVQPETETAAPAETPAETTTVPETTTTETTTVPETTTAETTTTPETTTVVTTTVPAETTTVATTTAPVVTTTVATTTVPVTTTAKTYPLPQPIYEVAPSMQGSVLNLAGKDMPVVDYSYLEDDVLAMVNAERAKCGVGPLTIEATLQHAAEVKVKEAFVTQIGGHTRPDGTNAMTANPYFGRKIGEGMQVIYPGYKMSAENYLAFFKENYPKSAGHYADVIDPKWDYIGIATYGTEGQFWVVLTYAYD